MLLRLKNRRLLLLLLSVVVSVVSSQSVGIREMRQLLRIELRHTVFEDYCTLMK